MSKRQAVKPIWEMHLHLTCVNNNWIVLTYPPIWWIISCMNNKWIVLEDLRTNKYLSIYSLENQSIKRERILNIANYPFHISHSAG